MEVAGWKFERGDKGRIGVVHGVTRETVRKWISGEAIPEMHRLAKIATEGGTTVSSILQGYAYDYAPTTEHRALAGLVTAREGTAQSVAVDDPPPPPGLMDIVDALTRLFQRDPDYVIRILAAVRALIPGQHT